MFGITDIEYDQKLILVVRIICVEYNATTIINVMNKDDI